MFCVYTESFTGVHLHYTGGFKGLPLHYTEGLKGAHYTERFMYVPIMNMVEVCSHYTERGLSMFQSYR